MSLSNFCLKCAKNVFFFLLSMLADKLNMSPEEAERWIVNLIRNARLDAKIDSKLVSFAMHCVGLIQLLKIFKIHF